MLRGAKQQQQPELHEEASSRNSSEQSFMGRPVNFYHNASAGSHAVVSRPSTGDRRKVPAK